MIISLARGKGRDKRNNDIGFSEKLILSKENKYELRAVCNHLSRSTKYGHYTAFVKRLGSNKWFECDDASVYQSKSFSTNSALMMIYTKMEQE